MGHASLTKYSFVHRSIVCVNFIHDSVLSRQCLSLWKLHDLCIKVNTWNRASTTMEVAPIPMSIISCDLDTFSYIIHYITCWVDFACVFHHCSTLCAGNFLQRVIIYMCIRVWIPIPQHFITYWVDFPCALNHCSIVCVGCFLLRVTVYRCNRVWLLPPIGPYICWEIY